MVFFELFSKAPEIVRVPRGAVLFREGAPGAAMYVLILGQASVAIGGRELEILTPGAIVGEMAIVSPGPRSATVTASDDCEFVEIDGRRFNELVRQVPEFALQVMRTLSERLRRADFALSA